MLAPLFFPALSLASQVCDWVDDITSSWDFRQVIPCHFAAPVKAGPQEFKRAFAFAYQAVEAQGGAVQAEEPAPAPASFFGSLFGGLKLGGGAAKASKVGSVV